MRLWKVKRVSLVISVILLLYVFVFSAGYHKYQIDAVIGNAEPEAVWEYVADFNKMRLLNPTILNFKILNDEGHSHDWRYTVRYTERLSHWPHWLNEATAKYVVTKTLPGVHPLVWAVQSTHETCFLGGLYCLRSLSEFSFSALGTDTFANEKIQYQCPPLLVSACRRELEFQRRAVMHNLTHIFKRT
ncbi:GH16571 [Drosophila grimshawi]|uniref:GH16571 n=2 Tax=Drosophila grimshawi TaxID=7222 RepID=B4J1P6_DROGR|nr:GH16571 [Drosophila grimshawi]